MSIHFSFYFSFYFSFLKPSYSSTSFLAVIRFSVDCCNLFICTRKRHKRTNIIQKSNNKSHEICYSRNDPESNTLCRPWPVALAVTITFLRTSVSSLLPTFESTTTSFATWQILSTTLLTIRQLYQRFSPLARQLQLLFYPQFCRR